MIRPGKLRRIRQKKQRARSRLRNIDHAVSHPCSHANAKNKEDDYLAVTGRRGASEADAKLAPFERRALAGGGGARLAAAAAAVPAAVAELARRRALLAGAPPAETAPPLRAGGAEGDAPLVIALRTAALPFGALRGRAALSGGGLPAGAALLLAGAPPG